MITSEHINELAAALAKAQGQMGGAVKDAANPFFKSKYADLASVWEACRKPLTDNGLAILQSPQATGGLVSVETLLTHTSGQWIKDTLSVSAKEDSPQAVGSAITYLRRYALQSFAGVAPEDDDGEAAHGRKPGSVARPVAVTHTPKGFDPWLLELEAVADEGTGALQNAWKASPAEFRAHLTTTASMTWDNLKARAAKVRATVGA